MRGLGGWRGWSWRGRFKCGGVALRRRSGSDLKQEGAESNEFLCFKCKVVLFC